MPAIAEYLKPEVLSSISRLDLQAQCIVEGFLSGLHRSPFHGFSTEFSEHRKYIAGDEPKTIDWNAYAKTEKLFVKKFEAQNNVDCTLIVDISRSMAYRYDDAAVSKLDYCISLAAAISYLLLRQQDSVGLATFDETVKSYVKPRSSSRQLAGIIGQLASVEPVASTNFSKAAAAISGLICHRGMIIVLSDFLEEPSALAAGLERLSFRRHDIIVFQILDRAELTLPFGGTIRFSDTEDASISVKAVGDDVRETYQAVIQEQIDAVATLCRDLGIGHLAFDTSEQFDVPLRRFLTSRKTKF